MLYHELGHAIQYLVDGKGESKRLNAEDYSKTYTGKLKSTWVDGRKVMQSGRGAKTQFQAHGYACNLETNNMRRHEWKVSRELGLPTRSTYLDIQLVT